MKNNGTCPKCSTQDVLVVTVTDQIESGTVGLTQDAYVCGACGYIEFYAREPAAIRAVARKLERTSPYRT
jgi:predicted nucleic-acid-binding Zn-ribbon protein